MPSRPVRFLYWNTGEKAETQEEVLAFLLAAHPALDVLLLGECLVELTPDFLSRYGFTAVAYKPLENEQQWQRIYFRARAGLHLTHLSQDGEEEGEAEVTAPLVPGVSPPTAYLQRTPRFAARAVLLRMVVDNEATLLACVHLASRYGGHQDELSQVTVASRYKTFIMQAGGQPLDAFGQRIAVVGDFNMNPFDAGMLQSIGFFAPNNRTVVRPTRVDQFVPERMFYNPCWALLSDIDPQTGKGGRISGTHYYPGAPSKKLHWHLLDQVIVSKNLIDRLVAAELRIVDSYLPLREYVENRTGEKVYSDHLPICFTLTLGTDAN